MANSVSPSMCKYCFDVIINTIKHTNIPKPDFDTSLKWYNNYYIVVVCLLHGKKKFS